MALFSMPLLLDNEFNLNSRCRYIYFIIFIGQGEHQLSLIQPRIIAVC